jgi:hypothetical protein
METFSMGGIVMTFEESAIEEAQAILNDLTGWRRMLSLLRARVRCNAYLLRAMWRGECEFAVYNARNRAMMVASVTGSIFDGSLVVHRVFWICRSA